jgi:hypothetical protein
MGLAIALRCACDHTISILNATIYDWKKFLHKG